MKALGWITCTAVFAGGAWAALSSAGFPAPDLLAAGEPAEIGRCEKYTHLLAADYRRTGFTVNDSAPMSPAAFKSVAGLPTATSEGEMLGETPYGLEMKNHRVQLRTVTITFADGAGTPEHATCGFRLIDGKVDDEYGGMLLDAKLREGTEMIALLNGRRAPARYRKKYECCLLQEDTPRE